LISRLADHPQCPNRQALSYENDPYQDDTGASACPDIVADDIGYTSSQVTQVLDP